MKFDFDNYKGKYAMHCKTEEEATEFCNVMHDSGRTWCNGDSYRLDTNWNKYKERMAYDFNHGAYGSIGCFSKLGYTILEWSDFRKEKEMTKKELKAGMVVECRCGGKYMALINTPMGDILVCDDGWLCMEDYTDDMRNTVHGSFDIIAVYEPQLYESEMIRRNWNDQKCIWRRSEVTEITLSEIAEKFGVSVENIRVKE